MPTEPGSTEWKNSLGALERTTTFPSGMRRKEQLNPRRNRITTRDLYPDAERTTYSFGPIVINKAKSEVLQEFEQQDQETSREWSRPEVLFRESYDIVQKLATPNDTHWQVHFMPNPDPSEQEFIATPGEFGDYATLIYDKNGLVQVTLQASPDIPEGIESSHLPWKEAFPLFVNYIKTEDPKNVSTSRQVHEFQYSGYLEDEGLTPDSSIVKSAEDLADSVVMDTLLKCLPMEDREDAKVAIEAFGWREHIMKELLQSRKRNSIKINDQFLNDLVNWSIFGMKPLTGSRQVVEFDEFSDTSCNYQERALEIKNDEEMQEDFERTIAGGGIDIKNPPSDSEMFEKDVQKHEGTLVYGMTIDVQGDIFSVERDSESSQLVFSCRPKGGKPWVVRTPLSIPFDQLTHNVNNQDPEVDFRKVKDLVGASFKRN